MGSNVLGAAVARVIGTSIEFVDLRNVPQLMPQQIAIFAPSSKTAEPLITADEGFEFSTAREVGDEFGYDSPAYRAARMVRPEFGGGVAGIKTVIFPIVPTAGAQSAGSGNVNIAAGNPSKNTTHAVNVNGRRLPFSVLTDDDEATLSQRIKDTLDAAIKVAPFATVLGLHAAPDQPIDFTAGWEGVTGDEISITFETGDEAAGVVYTNPVFAAGAGVFDVTAALANFGEQWFNIVVNACDVAETVLDQFENFNGSPENKTGRYQPTVMKPFVAFYGTVESDKALVTAVPDTRKTDLTNSKCPAPGSPGFTFESSAAYVRYIALTAGANPPKSYSGGELLDMPAPDLPTAAGDFTTFEGRDFIEKKGVSTAILKGDKYFLEDVNTHYHPDGVDPSASPYFRVVHLVGRTFNIIFQYEMLVETTLLDKILVEDVSQTSNPDAIDPEKWASIVREFIDDLQTQAITTKADESRDTVDTDISQTNPERMETSWTAIYSNNVRQADSTMRFGFNFG